MARLGKGRYVQCRSWAFDTSDTGGTGGHLLVPMGASFGGLTEFSYAFWAKWYTAPTATLVRFLYKGVTDAVQRSAQMLGGGGADDGKLQFHVEGIPDSDVVTSERFDHDRWYWFFVSFQEHASNLPVAYWATENDPPREVTYQTQAGSSNFDNDGTSDIYLGNRSSLAAPMDGELAMFAFWNTTICGLSASVRQGIVSRVWSSGPTETRRPVGLVRCYFNLPDARHGRRWANLAGRETTLEVGSGTYTVGHSMHHGPYLQHGLPARRSRLVA